MTCFDYEQNRARAEGFVKMIAAAGEDWPDGWVKGQGFVRDRVDADPMVAPPMVTELDPQRSASDPAALCSRHTLGLTPKCWWNHRENALDAANPSRYVISDME